MTRRYAFLFRKKLFLVRQVTNKTEEIFQYVFVNLKIITNLYILN